jgi:lipopolysaccharide export system permease protein
VIFHRSLLREFAGVALAVFSVLLAITLTTLLIRFLGQAASGSILSEGVLALLGFSLLNYLPILLSLTLFISVLMTLMRAYRDSEMIVWFCSGVSLFAWVRPVLMFAAPLVMTIALLSFVLSPWAQTKSDEFKRQLDTRDDVSTVAPGVFRESRHSDRVYFVENVVGSANRVANIFVHSMQHGKLGTMTAKSGFQETQPGGDRYLVLLDGWRYEGLPGSAEYKITHFERYSMRIEGGDAKQAGSSYPKAMSTPELLRQGGPYHMAELAWRIGLPLAATMLALLAIPLSFINPRAGRSLNLVLALLVYMVYSNSLSIAQAWIAQGKIGFAAGVAGVHAMMIALLLALFYRRLAATPLTRRGK